MKERKTRKMNNGDWNCPVHGSTVIHKTRMKEDDKGLRKYAGEYYACPHYGECGYYVSGSFTVPVMEND